MLRLVLDLQNPPHLALGKNRRDIIPVEVDALRLRGEGLGHLQPELGHADRQPDVDGRLVRLRLIDNANMKPPGWLRITILERPAFTTHLRGRFLVDLHAPWHAAGQRQNKPHRLVPSVSSGVNMHGQPPSITVIPCSRPNAVGSKVIRGATQRLFGPTARPVAILLTHVHPDHVGSASALARLWDVPVYVRTDELPLASGTVVPGYENPLDRWLIVPVMRLIPRSLLASTQAKASLSDVVRTLDSSGDVPGLPGWESIPTPGHTQATSPTFDAAIACSSAATPC